MPDQAVLSALTVCSAVCVGVVLGLLGSLKLALARRTDQPDSRVRLLLTALNIAAIPALFVAGVCADAWGVRPTLIAGSVLLALALLALSARSGFRTALLAVLAAALGAAGLLLGAIVLMPAGLFGPEQVAASMQLGMVFVALGAMLVPPLLDLLLAGLGFRRAMALLALVMLAPAFLAALPGAGTFPARAVFGQLTEPFLDPSVWMAALVCFCYAPLEAFVGVWTTTYLAGRGEAHRQSRWLLGFWGMLVLSRLLFGLVLYVSFSGDQHSGWYLVLPALLAAVVLGNMSGATRVRQAFVGLLLLGFFLGPVYPMLLSMLERLPSVQPVPATGYAILHAGGAIGSLALAPLVGLSLRARTVQTALRVPLLIALVAAAATLMFALLAWPTDAR